jgi:A118 family predicted phage portal protein
MPQANTIDQDSPLGVSIFARVADQNGLLHQADKLFSNCLWEYEAKQAAVFADIDMFKKDKDKREYLEDANNRLYKLLDIGDSSEAGGTKKLTEYSPEIRDISLFNGLNQIIRKIEFQVGLAYGTLSSMEETDKTATEVKMSKQSSYQTVKDIQNSLRVALEHLIYSMQYVGQIGIQQKVIKESIVPVDLEKSVSYDFDDSILVDHESELLSMQTDVSLGILKPLYYVMAKYKVDKATAQQMIQDEVITKPDPFQGQEE